MLQLTTGLTLSEIGIARLNDTPTSCTYIPTYIVPTHYVPTMHAHTHTSKRYLGIPL